MNNEKSILIKEEQAEETCPEPTTMFLGDPLGGYWSTDHLNGDSRLNCGWDENENNNAVLNTLLHTILEAESECCPPPLLVPEKELFLDDPLGVYWSNDHINEDSKLNFGWDENENNNAVLNTLLHIILEAESECCPPPLLVPKEKELFPDDTFGISCQTDFIKEDPELNLEADETQNTMPNTSVVDHMETGWIKNDDETKEVCSMALKDPLHNGEPSFRVKQEHEFKHNVDDSAPNVATTTGSESYDTRLIQHSRESCYISSEEIVKQEVLPGELGIDAGESMSFTVIGIHTQQTEEKDDSLFGIGLKCSLREKEFQTFSCSFCLRNFTSKYRLIMHVFIHIDGVEPPTYVCKSCGEVFCTNVSLSRHEKMRGCVEALFDGHNYKFGHIYNNENIVEGDQEVSFVELTENPSSNKKTRRNLRKFCNYNYKTQNMTSDAEKRDTHYNYRRSSITGNFKHRVVAHTYKCDVCGMGFTGLEHLKRHELIHTEGLLHTCNICGKSFAQLNHLKGHSLIHAGAKQHKCNICGKSFTRSDILKKHSLIHTGLLRHKCDICGKSFTWLDNLKRHSLIHTGVRPHKCDICGKSFTLLGHLKRHSLIHTGSHNCDVCGNSFTQLSDLKQHSLIHTGLKIFNCGICGKSFKYLHHLKRHSLIHTGTIPHNCDVCGKSFRLLDYLKKHSLTHVVKNTLI